MAKVYTAQEMREVADGFFANGVVSRVKKVNTLFGVREFFAHQIVSMLRQAADAMEREEKRVKKFEYAVKWDDGCIEKFHTDYIPSKDEILDVNKVLRREVGEWEEVRDGE